MTTSTAAGQAFNAGVRLDYTKHWECPKCPAQHVSNRPEIHTPLHNCPGVVGALIPFVEAGVKADFRINRREDYLGSDSAQTDRNGVPVMSITTLREDGEDCTVLAPTINVRILQD